MSKRNPVWSDEEKRLLALCVDLPPDLRSLGHFFTLRQLYERDPRRCALVRTTLSTVIAWAKEGDADHRAAALAILTLTASRDFRTHSALMRRMALSFAYTKVHERLEATPRADWKACIEALLTDETVRRSEPITARRTKLKADLRRGAGLERITLDILAVAGWGTGENAADNIRTTLKRQRLWMEPLPVQRILPK